MRQTQCLSQWQREGWKLRQEFVELAFEDCCVILGKYINLSGPAFLLSQSGALSLHPIRFWEESAITHVLDIEFPSPGVEGNSDGVLEV